MDTVHSLEECYRRLEVDLGASPFTIKRRYRRLAKQWHPDRYPAGSPEQKRAVDEMQKINHAYQPLLLTWGALNADFAWSVLLLPPILAWLFWLRSRVRAIALAVATLAALQDR